MKRFLLLFPVLLMFSGIAQQDPQFNMYQFNQLIINPAYAGARDGLAAVITGRKQWVGFDGAPQTFALSVHTPVMHKTVGVGLTVTSDKMGPRNVVAFYGNASYIMKVSRKGRLSFGLNAGYNRYQFNFSDIKFKADEVPSQLLSNQNMGALDLNAGMYFKLGHFFAGLSATHLNSPKIYSYEATSTTNGKFTYKLRPHLFFTIGKSFIIDKNCVFAPTMLIKQINNKVGADINLNFFLHKKVWLGAFYRAGYGPGALVQYYVNYKFRVGYSFDSGISDARKLGGSHEVMIGYDFLTSSPRARLINPRFL